MSMMSESDFIRMFDNIRHGHNFRNGGDRNLRINFLDTISEFDEDILNQIHLENVRNAVNNNCYDATVENVAIYTAKQYDQLFERYCALFEKCKELESIAERATEIANQYAEQINELKQYYDEQICNDVRDFLSNEGVL